MVSLSIAVGLYLVSVFIKKEYENVLLLVCIVNIIFAYFAATDAHLWQGIVTVHFIIIYSRISRKSDKPE